MAKNKSRPRAVFVDNGDTVTFKIVGTPQSAKATRAKAMYRKDEGREVIVKVLDQTIREAFPQFPFPEGIKV